MKNFFQFGSILFTVVILIIGFQNIANTFDGFTVFFFPIDIGGTLTVFGLTMLGMFAGAFYYGLILALIKNKQEDEDLPGGMN